MTYQYFTLFLSASWGGSLQYAGAGDLTSLRPCGSQSQLLRLAVFVKGAAPRYEVVIDAVKYKADNISCSTISSTSKTHLLLHLIHTTSPSLCLHSQKQQASHHEAQHYLHCLCSNLDCSGMLASYQGQDLQPLTRFQVLAAPSIVTARAGEGLPYPIAKMEWTGSVVPGGPNVTVIGTVQVYNTDCHPFPLLF